MEKQLLNFGISAKAFFVGIFGFPKFPIS